MEKRPSALALLPPALLLLWLIVFPAPVLACASNGGSGRGCRSCIVNQMKFICPSCTQVVRCMARCLWGGSSSIKCDKKCDCGGGSPKPSECKRCMARCKCSCILST